MNIRELADQTKNIVLSKFEEKQEEDFFKKFYSIYSEVNFSDYFRLLILVKK